MKLLMICLIIINGLVIWYCLLSEEPKFIGNRFIPADIPLGIVIRTPKRLVIENCKFEKVKNPRAIRITKSLTKEDVLRFFSGTR